MESGDEDWIEERRWRLLEKPIGEALVVGDEKALVVGDDDRSGVLSKVGNGSNCGEDGKKGCWCCCW